MQYEVLQYILGLTPLVAIHTKWQLYWK